MAKRFYKTVTVSPAANGYGIFLDARELKTPGRKAMHLQSQALAQLIADEWDAQEREINPETMPVTRLLNVAIERTAHNRDSLYAEVAKYLGTDLTCYRAVAPAELRKNQAAAFDDVLAWAKAVHDIKLDITDGLFRSQDATMTQIGAQYAARQDDLRLTLLVHFTVVFGSAALAIAVMDGFISASDALTRSRTDELFQIARWGEDEEAAERTENIRRETLALAKVLDIT
ncbi:ATP12 family chaperone protein [Robiginitomaculum antarcticum]|uniref:ATP12 family chaperone protein n=1 Tax=Robiginitomaculum antarcticum TaxID=437507 RepID=UPI00037FE07C|nr:ATP12 family protein [Robiginitomaculum antarcticum]